MNLIVLFGDGESPQKKWGETASLLVAHDAKFRHFFSGDISSITKQNKYIHSLSFNYIKITNIVQ
jgi:hypothetical protein